MCALYISETSWPFACMDFNFVDLNVTAWAERRVLNVACYYKPLAAATNTLTTHTALSTANAAQSAFQHRKVLSACPFPWSITEHFISPLPFRCVAISTHTIAPAVSQHCWISAVFAVCLSKRSYKLSEDCVMPFCQRLSSHFVLSMAAIARLCVLT